MTFTATSKLNDAFLVGGVQAALDIGPDPSYAILFEGTQALVTMVFGLPATDFIAHELVFLQGDPAGDQILVQGDADNFELYDGTGALLGAGNVTDMTGAGALKVSGTTGTRLYAGARAILGELKFN